MDWLPWAIGAVVALVGIVYKILDREILSLRKWKHERGEPHVNAMIALEKRVSRIERTLNGKLRDVE